MLKRKAEVESGTSSSKDNKKAKHGFNGKSETAQKAKHLLESESSIDSGDESETGGVLLEGPELKINKEYARRFEHNKKREELHRLEEKYKTGQRPSNGQYGDKYDEDEDSSSDESEDDEGILVTEDLDAQISTTLKAIRDKDPRVYDEKTTFYDLIEEDSGVVQSVNTKEKPMHLRDYHRENLLKGALEGEDNDDLAVSRTFAEEQNDLKKAIIQEMHAVAAADNDSTADKDDIEAGGFLVPKVKPGVPQTHIQLPTTSKIEVDVTIADKDPETFLSNFMAARAWVPTDGAQFQPLESDDEEEEERAERFEAAYNLRFEDPQGSNEVLKSYARDIVAARSVRREEPKSRKKHRDAEREKKEAEKLQREEERARLRKLKIDEIEKKLRKIKQAAGLRDKALNNEDWMRFLEEGWDDDKWETEMRKRFGVEYYDQEDIQSDEGSGTENVTGSKTVKKKLKKPTWDDDIIIKDIVPEFDEEELNQDPGFTLSDSEQKGSTSGKELSTKLNSNKDRQQEKLSKKKAAKLERKRVEEVVDNGLDIDHAILRGKSKETSRFRYRETSPISFGLTAHDILLAPDASLNQFVGLKKMATFRDPEKKRKDKRKLGKKARLRQWRRETFGSEEGPKIAEDGTTDDRSSTRNGADPATGKKKRRSRNKNKDPVSIEG